MNARWKVSKVLLLAIIFAFLLAASFEVAPASAAAFTNCATLSVAVPEDECQALVDLYDGTNGASWTTRTNWKATDNVCEWSGITCDGSNTQVESVNLTYNNLDGPFAGDFSIFANLEVVNLSYNQITGDIDTILTALPPANLWYLGLGYNQLTGSIDATVSGFTSLGTLDISSNMISGVLSDIIGLLPTSLSYLTIGQNSNITGEITANIGNLTNLYFLSIEYQGLADDFSTLVGYLPTTVQYLYLQGNNLTGTIPPTISNLVGLQSLDLSSSPLNGDMTTIFTYFPTTLTYLRLFNMDFTGTIPATVSNYTALTDLILAYNQLDGDLGTILNNLPTSIVNIHLTGNELTGTIPASISNLTNLVYFVVNDNLLTGDLGTIIGNLPDSILTLYLSNNGFIGSIPASIQDLTNLRYFHLGGNSGLNGLVPSQITSLSLFDFGFETTNICEPETTAYHTWKGTVANYTPGDCLYPLNGGAVVTTTGAPIVAIARPHIGSEIMAYSGVNSGANTVYLPMLFNDKWNYTSTFTIQNSYPAVNWYSIIFQDATDGSITCSILGESLMPDEIRTYDVSALPACDGGGSLPTDWFGGATVQSASSLPLVVMARVNVDGSDAVSYNGFTTGASRAYLPMLFRGKWGYQAAFYVQNLDPAQNADVTVEFYDSSGSFTCTYTFPAPILPLATQGIWMAGLTNATCDPGLTGSGFPAAGWAGNAVIKTGVSGSQSIVAIGRPHLGTEVAAYNGFSAGSTVNYLPMLFRGKWGYDAAIYVQNLGATPSTVQIDFYDADGNFTCTFVDPGPIGEKATKGYWTPTLNCTDGNSFPAGGWVGSAKVTTSNDAAIVGRPHLSDGQVVAYNAFDGGTSEAYVPQLFRNYTGNESALYIQNLDSSAADVQINFYDEETGFYCTMTKNVASNASVAIWLASLDGTVCTP